MLVAWLTLWFHPLPTPATHLRGLAVNNCIWYLLNYHKPKINTCLPIMTHVFETCGWRGQSLLSALVHHSLYFEAGRSRIPRFRMSLDAVHIPDRDKLVWQHKTSGHSLGIYCIFTNCTNDCLSTHTICIRLFTECCVIWKTTPN